MNRRKLVIAICTVIIILGIGICGLTTIEVINRTADDLSLRWTIIGAMGSWAGSIFGAIALVISLFALILPQRVKLKAVVGTAMALSQVKEIDGIQAYVVTVKNVGLRAVTINNVYLNFGGKGKKNIWVGMLNQSSLLQAYTPTFPKRLEQGESFDYYLHKDRLDAELRRHESNTPLDTKLFVCIDEVTTGQQYHKTTLTLNTFMGNKQ